MRYLIEHILYLHEEEMDEDDPNPEGALCPSVCICVLFPRCVYIYIYIYMCVCVYVYIYIYTTLNFIFCWILFSNASQFFNDNANFAQIILFVPLPRTLLKVTER